MKFARRFLFLAAFGLANAASAAADIYVIDPVHSSVAFKIRHFVSKVPAKFTAVAGSITFDPANLATASAEATIQTASLSTDNPQRDTHVKSADFLDAAKFPAIKFKSTSWKKTGENLYDVTGDLSIKDVTKPVVLKVTALGFGSGMGGSKLSGWEGALTIDKKDFNVKDPAMLDAALGDEVEIMLNIEAGTK